MENQSDKTATEEACRRQTQEEEEEACRRRTQEKEEEIRNTLLVEYRSIIDSIQSLVPSTINHHYANEKFDIVYMKEAIVAILTFDGNVLKVYYRDSDKPKSLKRLERMFERCSSFVAICIYGKQKNEICFIQSTLTAENMSKIHNKLRIIKRSIIDNTFHLPNVRNNDCFLWLRDGTILHVPQTFTAVVGICGIREDEPSTYVISALFHGKQRICGYVKKDDFSYLTDFIKDGKKENNCIIFKQIFLYILIEFTDYDGHYMTNVKRIQGAMRKATNIESFWK